MGSALARWLVGFIVPLPLWAAQPGTVPVGSIDFFGTAGIDVASIRSAIPLHPGDAISSADAATIKEAVSAAVARVARRPATDISIVCCDASGRALVYIGLPGTNTRAISHLPQPAGSTCLPPAALALDDRATDALQKALDAGVAGEDHSNGYALSHYPEYREAQLALRTYAVAHGRQIRASLRDCAQAENRAAAAQLLGYATRSRAQIDVLVRAARDSDAGVRNNAVRALMVLASARSRTAAATIPAAPFIAMLNSGTWVDRNKAGLLLLALVTRTRPNLVAELRRTAMDSLVEMARWQDAAHTYPYRVLLSRVAGLDDARVGELISAGNVEAIIDAARRR